MGFQPIRTTLTNEPITDSPLIFKMAAKGKELVLNSIANRISQIEKIKRYIGLAKLQLTS